MPRAPDLYAVILAAGESTRMGTDKALLPWPPATPGPPLTGQTFLSAAIRALYPFSEKVIVVVGKNENNLAPVVYANGASLVRNPDPDRGQFSSLQVGLQEVLNEGRDAAMVTLVDRPPARAATLQTLCSTFADAGNDVWAVVPEYNGKHGHPFLAAREMIEAFLKAPPSANARDIEHQNPRHISYVVVDDPLVTLNVDTPQEYAALSQ
ncbi:MAG TPA: nucleotidyltransferase family protein [Terriglobales bacterium]|jgi:molybdenum cofactor cytidylyltransferase|nr:nucleotidyltransferase family protein [Terriglobales bacterium]